MRPYERIYTVAVLALLLFPLARAVIVHGDDVDYLGVQNSTSGINTFWAIRYAQPPVRDLRWREPVPWQPPSSYNRTLFNATAPGPACIQSNPFDPAPVPGLLEDEDCLLLNVQTPVDPVSDDLPVLVNIHGGGYVLGSTFPASGDSLIYQSNGSIVYVSLQYRLGPLGFLAGDELQQDGTANAGLLDQRLALEWVRDNIHYFGGDPSKVTITGGSAGGGSVTMQMIMYGGSSEPPFRGVISEYPWWTPLYNETWVNEQYSLFLQSANCSTLVCLRGLSLAEIQATTRVSYVRAYLSKAFAYGTFYWGPVIDGEIIQDHPLSEYRNGHFTKVPLMVDRNYWECLSFTNTSLTTIDEVRSDLAGLWHDPDQQYAETALTLYPESSYNATRLQELVYYDEILEIVGAESLSDAFVQRSYILGDALIGCPSTYIAQSVADAGLPTYKMVFNASFQIHGATSPSLYSDIINADGSVIVSGVFIEGNFTLAEIMRSYWISFTRALDPNEHASGSAEVQPWEPYRSDDPNVLLVGRSEIETINDPDLTVQCQFLQLGREVDPELWPQW
jgi:carboxylesterase type B